MFIVAAPYDPLTELVDQFLRHTEMARGGTKKAEAESDARLFGYATGISQAVAVLLCNERVARYAGVKGNIEGFMEYQVLEVLRPGRDQWKALAMIRDTTAEQLKAVRDSTVRQLREMIPDERLDEQAEQARRQRILADEEQPTIEDIGWLTEERERLAAISSPLDRALGKLNG